MAANPIIIGKGEIFGKVTLTAPTRLLERRAYLSAHFPKFCYQLFYLELTSTCQPTRALTSVHYRAVSHIDKDTVKSLIAQLYTLPGHLPDCLSTLKNTDRPQWLQTAQLTTQSVTTLTGRADPHWGPADQRDHAP